MSRKAPVVTVDGPGGTGKGTLCQSLAKHLGWHLLDSGALYRVVALDALQHEVALDDEQAVTALAARLDLRFEPPETDGEPIVPVLSGRDVGYAIRTEACGNAASRVAALPAVRAALLQRQRDFRRPPGLVADGRDMGTVVFPDAALKVFLTASPEARAERRYKQLKDKGMDGTLAGLLSEIAERDARDSQRAVSPLKPAPDAELIDTTQLGIDAVLHRVLELVEARVRA